MNVTSNYFSLRPGNGIARQYKNLKSLIRHKDWDLCKTSVLCSSASVGLRNERIAFWTATGVACACALWMLIDIFHPDDHDKQMKKIEPEYNKIKDRAKAIYHK